jgi:hypothetical protein
VAFKVPGGPVMGSPAIINNTTFVAGCDSELHVIDTATGSKTMTMDQITRALFVPVRENDSISLWVLKP